MKNSQLSVQRGAIAIELAFVLGALAMCLSFSQDLMHRTSQVGELDNLSYAMVNILSEQELLFNQKPDQTLKNQQFREQSQMIDKIVKNHLSSQIKDYDPENYALIIERMEFAPTSVAEKARIARNRFVVFGNEKLVSKKPDQLELMNLSPFTSKNRFAPMFRVSIYHKSVDIFQRAMGVEIKTAVNVSSSISVRR
ncbi:tight adherence pilus pseudopilin TadF [Vibrio tapetis]|uniref:Uncharacterized protein n=1 Tax=Vibrio tapetis subsp. tapetis TaxID=1671868 RepID=A0A2N8ZLI0_9VIBR|nr:tight adherence pilus pseudopilin TadF [Vibrio tapetis]SON52760.1 protein of unknown function [Vibrio tapetis subsp. tapetis]